MRLTPTSCGHLSVKTMTVSCRCIGAESVFPVDGTTFALHATNKGKITISDLLKKLDFMKIYIRSSGTVANAQNQSTRFI